jgi:S1-C subfamily serine protease
MGYAGDEHDEESQGVGPEAGDDRPRRAIPDPLDRLWMHPSELSPFVGAAGATPVRHRPMWTATLVAGAVGAILTLGVLSAVGAIGRSSESAGEHQAVPTSAPMASAPIVSATAVAIAVGRRSVVTVSVHDESGTRRGSGVCVRRSVGAAASTKEILTSNRLVGSSAHVNVTTSDGVVHSARIVGRDATSDLVLLRLDSVIPAAAAAKRGARTGDTVWVVGAVRPGATSPWMSTGVLSSTDSLVSIGTGPTTSGLLETGAASSSASSGGALVDAEGNVTGIVLSPVGDGRMTYAVPIETALSIADDLRSLGHARHGALGINGIDAPAGPTVTAVVAGGPAQLAGIRVGDVVETVDKHQVDSIEDVMALVRHDLPGQPVMIELRRGSHKVAVQATLVGMDTR